MKRKLKLYVWEGVLTDYTDGIMFALAESADDARRIILEESDGLCSIEQDLFLTLNEYDSKVGLYLYGGG